MEVALKSHETDENLSLDYTGYVKNKSHNKSVVYDRQTTIGIIAHYPCCHTNP